MQSVTFASTNQNKFYEVQKILSLHGISTEFFQAELLEVQSDSLEQIATQKASDAFDKAHRPVIVEDDGLFIKSLKGFPGPYSSYIFKTLGNAGILKLLDGVSDRSAVFTSMMVFCDGKDLKVFEGAVSGRISEQITDGGWGFDPVFIPDGASKTFGQMNNKSDFSHRRKALEKFAAWFNPGIL